MTLEELRKRKKELGYTNKMIAEKTGIPLGTVQKIFAGTTKAPRWEAVQALQAIFSDAEERGRYIEEIFEEIRAADRRKAAEGMIRERAYAYGMGPKEERHTIREYYELPDERRVELIDGVFYDMASATPAHQAILGELYVQLYACVGKHPECELFIAPSDVRLDEDDYTVVQPDIYIFCDRKDPGKRIISGAPDFVVEILSPSTRKNDLFLKLNKYHSAGVREYWIVDPKSLKVTVYDLANDASPASYTFSDKVPVGISDGECVIDFPRIYEKVRRYL